MIRAVNLKKSFSTGIFKRKWFNAVDDVSIDIKPGETLGLVGESGCGKSTLGKMMLKLIEPTEGKVYLEDVDLNSLSSKELRRIRSKMQIIFQHPESALNPRMRIHESIMEPLRIQNFYNSKERKKAYELIDMVGLNKEHLNRYPHELSGGQIQRAVLARILSLKPRFIVADEPTSMLDVSVQAQVLNLLKDVQKIFNISYLFISHDLEVVCWISDRTAIMYNGVIVETGPAESIYNNPRHPYTRMLAKAFLELERKNSKGLKVNDNYKKVILSEHSSSCSFFPRCPQAGLDCEKKPELRLIEKEHYAACHRIE
ncbi:MAG: ATP-binding cassette domain-containing protein [Candidatus Contubernalis sp.]|nr:ATP-binding cassette domain-containing protein [Candidatus Contubernalis sp.]